VKGVSFTVGGTLIFLALSFTLGKRMVAHVIRWTNDNLRIEFAVLSAILVLMCLMSIITELIGVHTVLGAFVGRHTGWSIADSDKTDSRADTRPDHRSLRPDLLCRGWSER